MEIHAERVPKDANRNSSPLYWDEVDVETIEDCIDIAKGTRTTLTDSDGDNSLLYLVLENGAWLNLLLWAKGQGYRYATCNIRTNDGDTSVTIFDPAKEDEINAWSVFYLGT